MFAIRDIRFGVQLQNVTAPAPPSEVWAHVRQSSTSAYGGTTNAGNVWIWTPENGFERLNIHPAYGGWALAFGYNGYVYWQEQGYNGVRRRLIADGPVELLPIQPQAPGLLDVDPQNAVWTDDGEPWTWRRADGSILVMPKAVIRNGIALGYAMEWNGVAAYDIAADALYDVWHGDPASIPARLDDDGATACISGNLANGFIARDQWMLIQAPPIRPVSDVVPLPSVAVAGSFVFPVSPSD